MKIDIRPAILNDVASIAEIIKVAFDETPNINRISHQVISHHQFIYVAVISEQVVGFVENFITISDDFKIRLELDLLAVHPTAQMQGVGRKLIEATIQLAKELSVNHIRVLIASQNARMRYLCSSCGMSESSRLTSLYIAQSKHSDRTLTNHQPYTQFIPVTTLTYSGIWLEGTVSQQAIANAYALSIQHNSDVIGVVKPKDDLVSTQLLIDNHFSYNNDYHRWTLIVSSD